MSIQVQMEKEALEQLWEQMKQHIRERYIVQGFNFHLKRRVQLKQVTGPVVSAEVRGQKETFYAQLHLDDLNQFRCSCPFHGQCRHTAAVFFYLYASCGRPEMLMQEFYKEVAKKQKDIKQTKRKERRSVSIDEVEKWHTTFTEKVIEARILNETDPHRLWEKILAVLDQPDVYPEDARILPLYRFNMTIFVLNKVQQLVMNADRSPDQSTSFHRSLQDVIEQSHDSLQLEGWQSAAKYVMQTADYLTTNVLKSQKLKEYWLQLYQLFITYAASNAKRLERERLRLEGILQTSKLNADEKNILRMMLAHVDMIEGNDDKALKRMSVSGKPAHAFIIRILKGLHARSAWERLAVWLEMTSREPEQLNREEMSELAFFWKEVSERLGNDDQYEQWIKSCLPLSDHLYASYLFERKRYKEWIELQMMRGIDLSQFGENELEQMKQRCPEMLLPMYHQEVERLIYQKKRSSYIEAVQRLTELKVLYTMLGQSDRFAQMIEWINEKFKPYQALREEMMKGNLIS